MDTQETLKERLEILPEELREFILNEEWRKEVGEICKENSLEESASIAVENEVFLVLLCMENKQDLLNNLVQEAEIDSTSAQWVTEDVEKRVFEPVINQIERFWNDHVREDAPEKTSTVGQSFEQIIANQAKAMQPARKPGEAPAPHNLPTEETSRAIHNYVGKPDPYREAV